MAAVAPRRIGPNMTSVVTSSPANAWINDRERNISSKGTADGWAVVFPVPTLKLSCVPSNEMNMLARETDSDGSPIMGVEAAVSFVNVAAAVLQHIAQGARTGHRGRVSRRAPDLAFGIWVPCRGHRPVPEAASRERLRQNLGAR